MIGLNSQRKAAARFTGAAPGGMTLLLREILIGRGSISRSNTLGAKFLSVRAIGGGSTGGIYYNYTNGDGAPGAPEALGAYFLDKDSTLTGRIGAGGSASSGTGTLGQSSGTSSEVTVTSNLGGGSVVAAPGGAPNLGTNGPVYGSGAGCTSHLFGMSASGGRAGDSGGGANGSSPPPGYGGKGAGPYGGAGGVPNGDINGKAPGGGSAVKPRDASGIAYIGAGGDGGIILEWYA